MQELRKLMNKRQAKKKKKKEETFIVSFATSYRDLKALDRSYHEYMVNAAKYFRLHPEKASNEIEDLF